MAQAALILIDIQNDFCTGGRMAVPDGEDVVDVANQLHPHFACVIATKDWHPANHQSFAMNHRDKTVGDVIDCHGVSQTLWPVHCIQASIGADFHPRLKQDFTKIIYKGVDPNVDSYSAFYDNARIHETELHEYLQVQGVNDLYIMGLATDYCVKYSVLDAIQLGYRVFLVEEGCRGVNLQPGDSERAIADMQVAGAHVISMKEIEAVTLGSNMFEHVK